MDVVLEPGAWVDVSTMLQTIKKAGYPPVPEDVRLTVSGTIRKRDDGYVIELDKIKKPVTLALILDKDNTRTAPAIEEQVGKVATLEGRWQPAIKGQASIGSLHVAVVPTPETTPMGKP